MKQSILIAGGTGLVGNRLQQLLPKDLYDIRVLTRSNRQPHDNITYWKWDPSQDTIQDGAVAVDHIINLAGAGIADKRWSKARKKELLESRLRSTKLLKQALADSGHHVKTYTAASAVGYYGDRGTEILNEDSKKGVGYMADVCDAWEEASRDLLPLAERHAILRIGIVLSTKGGALPKVLMTKGLRIFNYFGRGEQYYPWIHIDDLCEVFLACLENDAYTGTINAVAPEPLPNYEFTHSVMKGCGINGLLMPAPTFALRLALGQMANVVLNSNRVVPKRLDRLQFQFRYTDVEIAVRDLLERGI